MNDKTLARFIFGSMAFIGVLILFTGCKSIYVTYDRFTPDGKTKVSTLSVHSRGFMFRTIAPKVTFNPDGSASLEGYETDSSKAVSDIAESVARGAVKGAVGK